MALFGILDDSFTVNNHDSKEQEKYIEREFRIRTLSCQHAFSWHPERPLIELMQ